MCAGCPYGKDFEFELDVIEKHEPKLFKAVNNIFKDSYEYTRKYREFRKKIEEQDKINKKHKESKEEKEVQLDLFEHLAG